MTFHPSQFLKSNIKNYAFTVFIIFFFSCEVENITYQTPYVLTDAPSSILSTSAILGGTVLGEGGRDVTEYGVVWSEQFPPTIQDSKIIEGTRLGTFSRRYEVFQPNRTYYIAAYAMNEVGVSYGGVYEFVTDSEPPCEPVQENVMNLGQNSIAISSVAFEDPPGFDEGNAQFETSSFGSAARIVLQFNEIDGEFPLTGEYTTVFGFDNQSIRSNGEVRLRIIDFSIGGLGGASAAPGEKIYVENDGQQITFIYCDVEVGSQYVFTGKYTYVQ